VRVWRFTHKRFVATAFSGEDGRLFSGRWHTKGTPLAYASEHAALCVLEALVHANLPELRDFRLVCATIPDALIDEGPTSDELPAGWDAPTAPRTTRAVGDDWLARPNRGVALRVPSALVPGHNVLLDPIHKQWHKVAHDDTVRAVRTAARQSTDNPSPTRP